MNKAKPFIYPDGTFLTYEKPLEAVLAYGFNWSKWLISGDTISSYSVESSSAELTVASISLVANTLSALVSGGLAGQTYYLIFSITTNAGLTDVRTLAITIKERS